MTTHPHPPRTRQHKWQATLLYTARWAGRFKHFLSVLGGSRFTDHMTWSTHKSRFLAWVGIAVNMSPMCWGPLAGRRHNTTLKAQNMQHLRLSEKQRKASPLQPYADLATWPCAHTQETKPLPHLHDACTSVKCTLLGGEQDGSTNLQTGHQARGCARCTHKCTKMHHMSTISRSRNADTIEKRGGPLTGARR